MRLLPSSTVSCVLVVSMVILTTVLPVSYALASRNVTLSNPVLTSWGTWGEYEFCPYGQFVVGVQLKTEYYQGVFSDDSGLNAVKFHCDFIGKTTGTEFITRYRKISNLLNGFYIT